MNNPAIKTALGVDPSKHFASCNMEVNQAFTLNGDGMHNSALLLPELVDAGVRLLVYAGNAGEFFRSSPSLFISSTPCGAAYKSSYLPRLLFPQVSSILLFTSSDVVVTVTRCMVGLRVAGRAPVSPLLESGSFINVTWCTLHAGFPAFSSGGAQHVPCSRNTFFVARSVGVWW